MMTTLPNTAACQCTADGACGRITDGVAVLCHVCQDYGPAACGALHYGADPALREAQRNYLHAVALEVRRPGSVGAWLALVAGALGDFPEELRA